jgi:hypothetical protein
MSLATILGLYIFSWLVQPSPSASAPQALPQPQNQSSAASSTEQNSAQPQSSPAVKPAAKRPAHPAKKSYQDCSNSPAALNPNVASSNQPEATKDADAASDESNSKSTLKGTANTGPSQPCQPQKKVVRNGGSNEPKIELLGGTPAQQASDERTTEQLTTATEENLKKISARPLSPLEQETLNQIKTYMEQAKRAIAAGDAERGHNLAMKARLLSDQLVKP